MMWSEEGSVSIVHPRSGFGLRRVLVVATVASFLIGCASTEAPPSQPVSSALATEHAPSEPARSAPASAISPSVVVGDLEAPPAVEGTLNDVLLLEDAVIAAGFSGASPAPAIFVFRDDAWSAAQVPGTQGQVMGLAQLGGQLIAVGNTLPEARTGFIWTSTDGLSWTEAASVADAALYDVVATHDVAIAVGAHHDAEMAATAAAWTSADGHAWAEGTVAGADGSSMRRATVWTGGFAASGEGPNGETQPIWTTSDATTWAALTTNLAPPRIVVDIHDWNGGLAAVGASDKSGNQHPYVALSEDGQSWTETVLSTEAEGYASALGVAGETLLAAGVDADRLTLWTLDADVWQPQTIEEQGATINALAWNPDLDLIGVGSKDGNVALWRLGGG